MSFPGAVKARLLAVAGCGLVALGHAADTHIGTYYFPGWRTHESDRVSPSTWQPLRAFPDRKPLLGYYDDGDVRIVNQQLAWMADSGIEFVALDWYWNQGSGVRLGETLQAYFKSANRSRVKLALLWANHEESPRDQADFDAMVREWLKYFAHSEYLRIDGKPVVIVFSVVSLEQHAHKFNTSARDLLERARLQARNAGYPGIFLIGSTGANDPTVVRQSQGTASGYDAFTAYNFQGPATYRYPDGHTDSHDFDELTAAYQDQWHWMLDTAHVPYVLPMTSGWDRRPWGGSEDPAHDASRPTLPQFARHLSEARRTIEQHQSQTRGFGIICCWNEFGEGSYIEPTQQDGLAWLRAVGAAFGQPGGIQ